MAGAALFVRRRPGLVAGGVMALALAVAAGLRWGSPLALCLALGSPAVEPWVAALGQSPGLEVVTVEAPGRALVADLYRPPAPRGALLLVHGLSRSGRRHPELARLARILAARGLLVLVPEFEGLAAFRLSGREVEEADAGLRELARRGHQPAIAGFSFGAGPALLAAASRRDLRLAASFGGYADLRHVVRYVATGGHGFGGRRYLTQPQEYNRWKLLHLLVDFVESEPDRSSLRAIAERKLADPAQDTGAIESGLGADGQVVLRLVTSRTEEGVDSLLVRLPRRAQQALEALSPLPVMARLRGRLLLAHGVEDDSIPFTESLRLGEAAGAPEGVALLETFHHTGPRPFWASLAPRLRDGVRLFRLAEALLAAE